jgi:hypothetical protein
MRANNFLILSVGFFLTLCVIASIETSSAQGPGCSLSGNSACGGTDAGQCAPHERFFTEVCPNKPNVNKCLVDSHCAATNKGRANINGKWRGGAYNIQQHGDALYITGGAAGPASGQFTGPFTISVSWAGPSGHFNAQVLADGNSHGYRINWDHPAGNAWVR